MIIRKWIASDNSEVLELERLCFKSPWNLQMFNSLTCLENFLGLVIADDNKIIGFIATIYCLDEVEILNIAISENYRNQGLGEKLVNKIIDSYKDFPINKIYLEVRTSNESAKLLYAKTGFNPIGIRKKYYENTEDAIVMARLLK